MVPTPQLADVTALPPRQQYQLPPTGSYQHQLPPVKHHLPSVEQYSNQIPGQKVTSLHHMTPQASSGSIGSKQSYSQSKHHVTARQQKEKEFIPQSISDSSPQFSRKTKNAIASYMANLTTSPKNRKESNTRKIQLQQTRSKNNNDGNCSNGNSCSCSGGDCSKNAAANCCYSPNNKSLFGITGGNFSSTRSRNADINLVLGSGAAVSTPDIPITSQLGSQRDLNYGCPSQMEDLSSSLPCPRGPTSVSEVALLSCYPSSSSQQKTTPCSSNSPYVPQQCNTMQYQLQEYQHTQYFNAQYSSDDRALPPASSPSPPPQYHQLSYDHSYIHPTLSLSSSPSPPTPQSASPLPHTSHDKCNYISRDHFLYPENEIPCNLSHCSKNMFGFQDDPSMKNVTLRSAPPLEIGSRGNSLVSLLSEDLIANSSHPPSYREVLECPDNYIIPSFPPRNNSSEETTHPAIDDDHLSKTMHRIHVQSDKLPRPILAMDEIEVEDTPRTSPEMTCQSRCGDILQSNDDPCFSPVWDQREEHTAISPEHLYQQFIKKTLPQSVQPLSPECQPPSPQQKRQPLHNIPSPPHENSLSENDM